MIIIIVNFMNNNNILINSSTAFWKRKKQRALFSNHRHSGLKSEPKKPNRKKWRIGEKKIIKNEQREIPFGFIIIITTRKKKFLCVSVQWRKKNLRSMDEV